MEQEFYNAEAEELLLASLLQNPERLDELSIHADMLNPIHNGPLLKTMLDLKAKGKPVEVLSIFERVKEKNIHKVGGIGFLTQLSGEMVNEKSFEYYQDTIREYFQKRKAREIGIQLGQGADPDKCLQALNEVLNLSVSSDTGDIRQAITELYSEVVLQEGHGQGIKYRYKDLDEMTEGAHPGDLIIIAARPSVGKTALALNMAINMAGSRENPDGAIVVLFSLEMGDKQLIKRLIANKGHMDMSRMRQAHKVYSDGDRKQFNDTLGMVSEMDIKIFDQPADMKFITAKSREIKRQNPERDIIIMIDYLQLIIGNPIHRGNKQAEVGDSSQKLKQLARELDCPVIALSQLSRAVEQRQDKRPVMSDLRDSGQVEQDADTIMMLYRDEYYNKETEDRNQLEIIIVKQRNGPTGDVKLGFVKEYGKFVSVAWGQE